MIVAGAAMSEVRRHKMAATQRLLGDTIAISEADWLGSTALPGWTRAHVATHLARNADVMRRYLLRLAQRPTWESDDDLHDLEAGARRTPLEIQIDIDTSSGLLNDAFNLMTPVGWQTPLHGIQEGYLAEDLVMMRLNEVVIHHVDLDCGFVLSDIPGEVTDWLLTWNLHRRQDLARGKRVRLVTTEGRTVEIGTGPIAAEVTGTSANLLGWLTGRLPRTAVSGAEHLSIGSVR